MKTSHPARFYLTSSIGHLLRLATPFAMKRHALGQGGLIVAFLFISLLATAPDLSADEGFGPLTITGERTYSFDAKYPNSDPCVVSQELLNRTSSGGTACTGDLEADGTADVLEFTNWHWDTFFSPDIGLNLRDTLPAGTIADPAGDSFKFTSFTTEVFSCGVPISFEVVGYEDGSQVGSQSFNFGAASAVTIRTIEFASVDEVRFENYSDNASTDANSCMTVDDIVVDQAVSSNTQPGFSNLDATVVFDEAAGSAVAIDTDATVSDAELDGAGDYAGSTLTVAREGGANGDDDFGFDTASASFSVSGGDLLNGGAVFASFTESGGTLTVDFNSNATTATPALADEVLQSLTYANTGSPVVVEYGVTLNFDDGGLQTAQSLPVEYDPVLAAVTSDTTWDFTELGPTLPDKETIDARVVAESGFDLLFYGFKFGDAAENALIDSNEFQLDQRSSDPFTTGTRFESDAPFSLEQIDIDNFSTSAQDVEVHAYLGGSPVGSRSFSYGAENGYQTEQFASADAAFANVDEIRFTTSENGAVAVDNIVIEQGNEVPSLDLDTSGGGDGAAATFSENTDQGTALSDGVWVTGPAAVNDPDGTVDSATLTLDNPQGDVGEGLSIDTAPLAGALGFSTSADLITITRNTATKAELVEAIEAVRYQNNSDTPDTTARSITVEVTDDGGATASAAATISMEAGNDTPVITSPGGTLQPDEDVAFDMSGANEIQIADVDAGGGTVKVSLSANNGTLTLGSTTGLGFDSGGNGTSAFKASGTVTDLNSALATLDYQANANYFGADTISASVNDRGNSGTDPGLTGDASSEADSASVSLDIQPVPDAPAITAITNQSTDEDTTIGSIAFTIDDVDTPTGSLMLSLNSDTPSLIGSHAFGGSTANRTLQITPAADENGSAVMTVTVSDGSLTAEENFVLTVNAVNDLPTVSPAISTFDATVDEDDLVPPSSFTVDDVESGGAGVTVTASSDNQTLVPNANLSVADNGGGNRALDVTLAADENGSANITVTLDDGTDTVDDSFTLTAAAQNDPPAVSLDQNSTTIDENNGGNITVTQITIDDDNEDGSTNELSLNGADAADFAISGAALDFTGNADFEAKDTYDVAVEVDDPAVGSTPDDTANFTLNISNVDEAPSFSATGPFSVSESGGNGTAVGDVDATDGDGGATDANVSYSIVGGNTGGAFAIDVNVGSITVADADDVDYDTSPTFNLDVEANDGTNTATATITVNVINAAPSTPVDSDGAAAGGGSVSEDAPNGTTVGITADASDPGGGPVSYDLTDTAGGRFQINAATGIVTVADTTLIDYESATSHTITAQAADDEGADSDTASFTIAVTDVDSPPEFVATGPFSVSESAGGGSPVGDVDANDGDGGSADAGITYAITGGNGGAFAIDNSGAIIVADASAIDFENSSSFALTIEADDGGSTASATVTVDVIDEPPAQPVDTDGGADSVAEDAANGDPVGVDVTSSDPVDGTVTYVLTDDASGRFAIDANGLVTVADGSLLDYETDASHDIEIKAQDADDTASATLAVTIKVTDVNEAPTLSAIDDQTTDEDQPLGTIALTVGDIDNPAGELTLSLSSDDPSLIGDYTFSGSDTERNLDLAPAPDAFGTANVSVAVSDGDLSTSQSFIFEVEPVNDPPRIVSTLNDISIVENQGSLSFDVRVDDVDDDADSLVVTGQSDRQALIQDADIVVTGTGETRQVEISPVADGSGSASITMTVDDGTETASASFNVFVRPFAIPLMSWPGRLILAVLLAVLGAAFARQTQRPAA
ncbi:MAG: cadherin domain-containing protein [Xanthomonadales bacterium]|nr:cadherin domain-containing protein [Xanthomonadales bacterium]